MVLQMIVLMCVPFPDLRLGVSPDEETVRLRTAKVCIVSYTNARVAR